MILNLISIILVSASFTFRSLIFQIQIKLFTPIEESLTILEDLALKSNFEEFDNPSRQRQEVDQKIREFLSEDSIIERTRNCQNYFRRFIPSPAANNEVSFKLW